MKKKVEEKKTLKYAVSFIFYNTTNVRFMIKDRLHEYINTIAVLHDLKYMKYIAVNVDKDPIGNKEITIL